MAERHPLNIVPVGMLVGLALAAAACDVAVDTRSSSFTAREEKRFAVTGRPDVTIGTFDGSIDIKSWDRPEVLVEIEKRAGDKALADAILIKAEQSGNRIRVEVPKPSTAESGAGFHIGGGAAFFGHVSSSARLTVTVPADCDVMARTGDGSIAIQRVSGRLDLDTSDGGVRGRDLGGSLKVHTSDGALSFRDLKGAADLDTGDGGIELSGVLSAVRALTGDGSVTVRAEPGSAAAAAWEIRTGDGSVSIDVPETISADLDARTSDGSVLVDGLSVTGAVAGERQSLRGTLGAGGPVMRIRTGSGTITLRRF
jgi:hypothetical protein